MAENRNFLDLDNNFGSCSLSNGNDLLYVTAESDILNVANDTSNASFQLLESESNCSGASDDNLKNIEHPNLNVSLGDIDLSISEKFARMKLHSEGSERNNDSFSESKDKSSENRSDELSFRITENLHLEETLTSSEVSSFLQQNVSSPLAHGGTLHCSEIDQSPCPQDTVKEITTSFDAGKVCGQDVSNNNLFGDSRPLPEEKGEVLQDTPHHSLLEISSSSGTSKILQDVQSECVGDNISLNEENTRTTLDTSQTLSLEPTSISNEVSNSSSLSISGSKSNPGVESAVDHGIVPSTENQDLSFFSNLSVKSADSLDSFPEAKADVSCEVLNLHSLAINESESKPCNESVVNHGDLPSENQDLSFFSSLPIKTSEPIDGIDSSFQDAKDDSCEVSNSSSLSISGSKLNPGNQNPGTFPSTEYQEFSSLSIKSKEDPFKIPALPRQNIEPKAMPSLDISEQDLLGQSMSFHTLDEVSSEISISGSSTSTTKMNPCENSSEHIENQDATFFGGPPGKSAALTDDCLGIPDSMAFIDLKDISNPGNMEDDPFKIPAVPQDEEEMFTDAVQFFKDPSSLQFLENIQTSGPPESVIPRSSLYVVFDPLHSKMVPESRVQNAPVLPRRSEAEVEPGKNSSVPVNKHLADVSVRESMGNILISFDSPKTTVRAQSDQVEDAPTPSVVPKHYTEEELQQALKTNELTLQEMYLRQHRELEQEMAKMKEESKATIEKLSCLCKTQRCIIVELFDMTHDISESKKEMQEKMDIMEKDNEKLKEDLKTSGEDLQSVESTFSDFHKRYEQCKGMLKTYKDNEVHLREGVEVWKTKLVEQEHKYNALQERTQEILEKANAEVASAKKSSDGQVTVLKAQLKKAELKISGLESDIKQIKMENSQLGGICDDLMAQVSES